MVRTAPGTVPGPADLPAMGWLPASVPGTAAAALRAAGEDGAARLHAQDVWYVASPGIEGPAVLRCAGLATRCEIWLDGDLLGESASMFLPLRLPLRLRPDSRIALCFRALHPALPARDGRARWRSALARPATLRHVRTTLLGQMPGWCPEVPAVGPWRPVELLRPDAPAEDCADLQISLCEGTGHVALRVAWTGAPPEAVLHVGEAAARLHPEPGGLAGGLAIAGVRPWWPHTHGEPVLYPAAVEIAGRRIGLGGIGFRSLEIDRAEGGFALRVNGEPVFCRGACWTSADLVALPGDAASYRPALLAMRDAGMNMLRLPGCMAYETHDLLAVCDELGLLVWHDFAFARFDYPQDEAFLALAAAEARHVLAESQGAASLAVLCGGHEVAQQAAMLGRPDWSHPLFDRVLPAACAALRPEVPYVAHSPEGGAVPFLPERGISHWWSVGAYLRPLDEARRAPPRFTSACLAFAIPGDGEDDASPRDPGAAWDFADVRDHYLRLLTGQDPVLLRRGDAEAYRRLSRAVVAEVMQAVLAEWRRTGSICAGALVWTLQDVAPGAGWGLLDVHGGPKAPLHALREVLRPVQVLLTEEGMNGLHLHLINETDRPVAARLSLRALRDGAVPVAEATEQVALPPRSAGARNAMALLGGFFDFTGAYAFGPPGHDAVVASLEDAAGTTLSEAFFFPRRPEPAELGLQAELEPAEDGWALRLSCDRLARFVHLEDAAWRAEQEWFHLPPRRVRRIRLLPRHPGAARPDGVVHAMNAARPARCRMAA